jgi:DNA-binding XRE family transcriptional regulator
MNNPSSRECAEYLKREAPKTREDPEGYEDGPIPARATDEGNWLLDCYACDFRPEFPFLCEECKWEKQLYACGVYPLKRLKDIWADKRLDEGSDLKTWRKDRGLTQAKVAEILGVDQSIVSRVERGEKVMPSRWVSCLKKAKI